jgi:hypothetical protein
MRKVERSDILDFQTYGDRRESYRAHVLAEKAKRRVHVGEYLTFLFESTDTIAYQVQEMMRLEQIAREKDIRHEIDTYNQLLGGPGELGCTLLIEIADPAERDAKLRAWLDLPAHLYIELEAGHQVRAQWDKAQVGDTRLSSVQYVKFAVGEHRLVAIGCDHPELTARAELTAEQRETLMADLRS